MRCTLNVRFLCSKFVHCTNRNWERQFWKITCYNNCSQNVCGVKLIKFVTFNNFDTNNITALYAQLESDLFKCRVFVIIHNTRSDNSPTKSNIEPIPPENRCLLDMITNTRQNNRTQNTPGKFQGILCTQWASIEQQHQYRTILFAHWMRGLCEIAVHTLFHHWKFLGVFFSVFFFAFWSSVCVCVVFMYVACIWHQMSKILFNFFVFLVVLRLLVVHCFLF